MNPVVTCICPTFGRAPNKLNLLTDAVYWFDQQTYPSKELLIWNDCYVQELRCFVPGVRIINSGNRFPTLGHKYNAMVEEAKGEIILPWEDDDVSLPGRIEQAVQNLRTADYFNPQGTWYQQNGQLHWNHKHGVCHNASAYRKSAWKFVGGYTNSTGNQDALFDQKLKSKVKIAEPLTSRKDWTYIYRWGVSNVHLSGAENMQKLYNEVVAIPLIAYIPCLRHRDYVSEVNLILSNPER